MSKKEEQRDKKNESGLDVGVITVIRSFIRGGASGTAIMVAKIFLVFLKGRRSLKTLRASKALRTFTPSRTNLKIQTLKLSILFHTLTHKYTQLK